MWKSYLSSGLRFYKAKVIFAGFVVSFSILFGFIGYNKLNPTFTSNGVIYGRDLLGRVVSVELLTTYNRVKSTPVPFVEPTGPVSFTKMEVGESEIRSFHRSISEVFVESPLELSCLEDTRNLANRVTDKYLLKQMQKIDGYKFSDELRYQHEDGRIDISNKGERSVRTITYTSVCKTSTHYFFLFSSYGPKVHFGGGGSEPTHFAYADFKDNLVLLETPSKAAKTITAAGKRDSVVYYGCRTFYGATSNYAYYGCGGGDGPASAGSIFQINLGTKEIVEKDYCVVGIYENGERKESCYDENNKVYLQY